MIGGTGTRVDAVVEVAPGDRGLHRQHVVERGLVGIEGWIGKAVRMSRLLISERHQPREDRARETRPADAVLVVVRTPGERLCLSDEQPRLRITQCCDVRYSAAAQAEACA